MCLLHESYSNGSVNLYNRSLLFHSTLFISNLPFLRFVGVYTYRTAVHLKSGHQWLDDSLVHQNPSGLQALDVLQAAMAALLPMTF